MTVSLKNATSQAGESRGARALRRLFRRFDESQEPLSLPLLSDALQDLTIERQDVADWVRFHPDHYVRNLIHAGPAYHALLLCWGPGQRSPIHDHTGSACAVRVICGTATETFFQRSASGMIYATRSRFLQSGEICVSEDSDIHQVSNLEPDGCELVTLHIYSPPLLSMNVYSLDNHRVDVCLDPVHEDFTAGSGI